MKTGWHLIDSKIQNRPSGSKHKSALYSQSGDKHGNNRINKNVKGILAEVNAAVRVSFFKGRRD